MDKFKIGILSLLACGLYACPPASDGQNDSAKIDSDNDLISDLHEGWEEMRDSDGDGVEDYLDEDSDGDGLADALEAGDLDVETPAFDSDRDRIPDYLDDDSDDNGLADKDEEHGDHDGDGILDVFDLDDDNDGLSDSAELAISDWSVDSDGDGLADIWDADSDNDNIADGEEGVADPDSDNVPSYLDSDADGDGIDDITEAGDGDLATRAVDTDGDGSPDFHDLDADNDGLSDEIEATVYGSFFQDGDSDDDGVSDLVEYSAGTNATDPSDNPQARGDFVFVLPYEKAAAPSRDTLDFSTALQNVDIYFSFDVTGSMSQELAAMGHSTSGVPAIIDELRCSSGENASVTGCIPDLRTGVGAWSDVGTFNHISDFSYSAAHTARNIPTRTNGRMHESPTNAAACVAGEQYCQSTAMRCSSNSGIGCPAFREDAVRVLVQITDADDQSTGRYYSPAQAGSLLGAAGIQFVSLIGIDDDRGRGTPRSIAEDIGVRAGSVDARGLPFVYDAADSAVVGKTVEAIRDLAGTPTTVQIEKREVGGDDGAALRFIDRLEVNRTNGACDDVGRGNSVTISGVVPGSTICWDVVPKNNTLQEPGAEPLLYKARLVVRAAGSVVDSRDVYFLVPPQIQELVLL